MTRQRRVILEELGKVRTHPTADRLYLRVRRRLPRISLGTVYRNLEALAGRGLIRTLDFARTPRRFDGDTGMHYHIFCTHCGRVADVPIRDLGPIEDAVRGMTDYQILGHRLKFIGLCPQCKTR